MYMHITCTYAVMSIACSASYYLDYFSPPPPPPPPPPGLRPHKTTDSKLVSECGRIRDMANVSGLATSSIYSAMSKTTNHASIKVLLLVLVVSILGFQMPANLVSLVVLHSTSLPALTESVGHHVCRHPRAAGKEQRTFGAFTETASK